MPAKPQSTTVGPSTKILLLVSDVDGTLGTDDKILTAHDQTAVAELHAHGIVFTIISSRPHGACACDGQNHEDRFANAIERFILGGDCSSAGW